MSHDLLADRMAYVGDVPWHGLGKQVPERVTAAEMCRAAGLDWAVWKERAAGARQVPSNAGDIRFEKYLVMRAPVAIENGPTVLGLVGPEYELLQNRTAFDFFNPLVRSGYASFHTAGAIANGEVVWVMARIAEKIEISKKDTIERFVLLSNTHNGSGAVTVRFTPIRVVCQNTLNYAKENAKPTISIRHTRHVARNIELQASELKLQIESVFRSARQDFFKMAARKLKDEDKDRVLEALFPRSPTMKKTKSYPERWARVNEMLSDPEMTPPETKETVWGLYNAITADEDHRTSRERSNEARFQRIWYGSGQELKLRALNACRALVWA